MRADSGPGESVIRFKRKRLLAGFVLVLLAGQILHGTENYDPVQTQIALAAQNQRQQLTSLERLVNGSS